MLNEALLLRQITLYMARPGGGASGINLRAAPPGQYRDIVKGVSIVISIEPSGIEPNRSTT